MAARVEGRYIASFAGKLLEFDREAYMKDIVSCIRIIVLLFALLMALPAGSQERSPSPRGQFFTYDQAFDVSSSIPPAPRAGSLLQDLPQILGWTDDDHFLEVRTDPDNKQRRIYRISAADGSSQVYIDSAAIQKDLPPGISAEQPAASTSDYTRLIFGSAQGLYYYDVKSGRHTRLTATTGKEQNPRFSPNAEWLAYTRNHNLYIYDLKNDIEHACTTDGSETHNYGWASWVYYEEVFDRASEHAAFWWSPDSTRLAFMRFDDTPVPSFPIFHADGQHGELELERYPKAGDPNPRVAVGVFSIAGGTISWMDFNAPSDEYLAWPVWTSDSKRLSVQWMNRRQNTIRIYSCDPDTGAKSQIFEEQQPTWVLFFEDLYSFKNGGGFLLRSDIDGWGHIYYYAKDGILKRRLTSGRWRVQSIVRVDEERGYVYFIGRPTKSWDQHLMRVKLDGTKLEQLTKGEGIHQAIVSPGGEYFIDTVSTLSTPPSMSLYKCDGAVIRTIGDAKSAAMDDYAWGRTELFTIPSGDGFDLPAYWVLPVSFDPAKAYPVIFTVYGGPDMGMVQNRWLGLQPHYWAQRGIITISVDHRGGGQAGRKGINYLYRNLGKWEMQDLATAVKWLRSKPFISKDKIGITGSSYGGYLTLMALTRNADYFNFGVAGSPVTDWRLYDSIYTERYMDTPDHNPDGYKDGAVMTWIHQYKGLLRITHGTIDDNVHMQNSIQIIDWLTRNNKHFEMMIYPNSRHSIGQRSHLMRESHDFWMRVLLGTCR